MHVLVAPGDFSGLTATGSGLSAAEAAEAIASGWCDQLAHGTARVCPIPAPGPGALATLEAAWRASATGIANPAVFDSAVVDSAGFESVVVATSGPYGQPCEASVIVVGRTAFVEAAQCCAAPDGATGEASSAGLARVLHSARQLLTQRPHEVAPQVEPDRLVIILGGERTHDAGSGMLHALAELAGLAPQRESHRLDSGGLSLRGIDTSALEWLPSLRALWQDCQIDVVADTATPLLGFHGTSASEAPRKGADPATAQALERALGDFAAAALRVCALPASGGEALTAVAGSGAGGGLGFALALLGAQLSVGPARLVDAVGLQEQLRTADLVITGTGRFDWTCLRDSVITEVATRAQAEALPVVVVAGVVQVGRREAQTIGVDAAYPLLRAEYETLAVGEAAVALHQLGARVARTWSRR